MATAEIVKVDTDQQLVFGWASVIADHDGRTLLDRQGDYIDSDSEMEKAAYDYVLHSRDGGEMHIRKGVATLVESMVFSVEKQQALGITPGTMPVGWWIGFKVTDEGVWNEVKKGGYVGFSVHGTGRRQAQELDPALYSIDKVSKRDAGSSWPAAAYAYRGELSKPSTWRFRVWESIEKQATPRSVGMAVLAFERSSAKMSPKAAEEARSTLHKTWQEVCPDQPTPAPLKKEATMSKPSSYQAKTAALRARVALAKYNMSHDKANGRFTDGSGGSSRSILSGDGKRHRRGDYYNANGPHSADPSKHVDKIINMDLPEKLRRNGWNESLVDEDAVNHAVESYFTEHPAEADKFTEADMDWMLAENFRYEHTAVERALSLIKRRRKRNTKKAK